MWLSSENLATISDAECRTPERDIVAVEHIVWASLEDDTAVIEVAYQPSNIVEDDADAWHCGAEDKPDWATSALSEVEKADAVRGIPEGLSGRRVRDQTLIIEVELDGDGVAHIVDEGDDAIILRERLDEGDAARAGTDIEGTLVVESLDMWRGGISRSGGETGGYYNSNHEPSDEDLGNTVGKHFGLLCFY